MPGSAASGASIRVHGAGNFALGRQKGVESRCAPRIKCRNQQRALIYLITRGAHPSAAPHTPGPRRDTPPRLMLLLSRAFACECARWERITAWSFLLQQPRVVGLKANKRPRRWTHCWVHCCSAIVVHWPRDLGGRALGWWVRFFYSRCQVEWKIDQLCFNKAGCAKTKRLLRCVRCVILCLRHQKRGKWTRKIPRMICCGSSN